LLGSLHHFRPSSSPLMCGPADDNTCWPVDPSYQLHTAHALAFLDLSLTGGPLPFLHGWPHWSVWCVGLGKQNRPFRGTRVATEPELAAHVHDRDEDSGSAALISTPAFPRVAARSFSHALTSSSAPPLCRLGRTIGEDPPAIVGACDCGALGSGDPLLGDSGLQGCSPRPQWAQGSFFGTGIARRRRRITVDRTIVWAEPPPFRFEVRTPLYALPYSSTHISLLGFESGHHLGGSAVRWRWSAAGVGRRCLWRPGLARVLWPSITGWAVQIKTGITIKVWGRGASDRDRTIDTYISCIRSCVLIADRVVCVAYRFAWVLV
jgi:hypothetical protein